MVGNCGTSCARTKLLGFSDWDGQAAGSVHVIVRDGRGVRRSVTAALGSANGPASGDEFLEFTLLV